MSSIIKPRHGEDKFAIGRFIIDRAQALGLSRTDLALRFGYTNVGKGQRALTDLLIGGLITPLISDRLVAALEVEQRVIDPIIQMDPLKETGPRARCFPARPAPLPMDFPATQVIVCEEQVQHGPYMRTIYLSIVDADVTEESGLVSRVLSSGLREYLNQYFVGWRLLRRVHEQQGNYRGAPPYKDFYYVLVLDTDADADTVASHLHKIDYVVPYRKASLKRGSRIPS